MLPDGLACEIEQEAELLCGVGVGEDAGGDGDGVCAGRNYFGGVGEGDAGDGDQGGVRAGLGAEAGYAVEADGLFDGVFGGGGEDGADGEVVGGFLEDAGEEIFGTSEGSDDVVGAEEEAGFSRGGVSGVDVDAVKAGGEDEVGAVVEDEADVSGGHGIAEDGAIGEDAVVGVDLVAVFEEGDASVGEGLAEVLEPEFPALGGDEGGVEDGIDARKEEAHTKELTPSARVDFRRSGGHFVGRGAVGAGDAEVLEAHGDAELGAVVDEVVEDPGTEDTVLRIGDPDLAVGAHLPVGVPLFRCHGDKGFAGFGAVGVEALEESSLAGGDVGLELVVGGEDESVCGEGRDGPFAGGLDDVADEAGHGHGFGVRLEAAVVLFGNGGEEFAGGRDFAVEFGDEFCLDIHDVPPGIGANSAYSGFCEKAKKKRKK